jgi:Holliday junction resolvase RusA-like endonuclease
MNEAFMGRKRKTAKYRDYEIKVPKELPDLDLPDRGPLGLRLRAGLSNRAADLDNVIKPFLDILQSHYGFNDNRIYYIEMTKVKIAKGEEYVSFELYPLPEEPSDLGSDIFNPDPHG